MKSEKANYIRVILSCLLAVALIASCFVLNPFKGGVNKAQAETTTVTSSTTSEITAYFAGDGSIIVPQTEFYNPTNYTATINNITVTSDYSFVKDWTNDCEDGTTVESGKSVKINWTAPTSVTTDVANSLINKTAVGTITYNYSYEVPDLYGTVNISGKAAVGNTLTASVSSGPLGITYTYTWYRGDTEGATTTELGTGTAYTIVSADEEKYLTCVVTDSTGYYGKYISGGKNVGVFKYAVSLYGINHDVDSSGNSLGLTFGPAIGANYTASYKSHTASGTTAAGNEQRCIHSDEWATIIEWAEKDPEVYEGCLTNGCTHSVKLTLNSTLKSSSTYSFTGDGTGMLYDSLNSTYRVWNGTSSSYNNTGGWRASFMRRTLNGSDYCNTVDGSNTISSCTQGATPLTSENCLLSCFPTVLQNNIKAAAKKTDTVYNDTSGNNMTTYDKLWLLSGAEIWQSGASTSYARPNEGTQYQSLINKGVTTSAYSALINYREAGNAFIWWTRSSYVGYSGVAYYVGNTGNWDYSYVYNTSRGVAPCFCL